MAIYLKSLRVEPVCGNILNDLSIGVTIKENSTEWLLIEARYRGEFLELTYGIRLPQMDHTGLRIWDFNPMERILAEGMNDLYRGAAFWMFDDAPDMRTKTIVTGTEDFWSAP